MRKKTVNVINCCFFFSLVVCIGCQIQVNSIKSTFPIEQLLDTCKLLQTPVTIDGINLDQVTYVYVETSQEVIEDWLLIHPNTSYEASLYPCQIANQSYNQIVCTMTYRPLGSKHDFIFLNANGNSTNFTFARVFPKPLIFDFEAPEELLVLVNVHFSYYWAGDRKREIISSTDFHETPSPEEFKSGAILFYIQDVPISVNEWICPYKIAIDLQTVVLPNEKKLTFVVEALDEQAQWTFENPFFQPLIPTFVEILIVLAIVMLFVSLFIAFRLIKSYRKNTKYTRMTFSEIELEIDEERQKKQGEF